MVSVTDFSSKKTQAYQAQGRVKNSLHRNNEQENRHRLRDMQRQR